MAVHLPPEAWVKIEQEFRTGQAVPDIARRFGCHPNTVYGRARKEGWRRDLSREVAARTKAALWGNADGAAYTREDEEAAVRAAAAEAVELVRQHRGQIRHLRGLVDTLAQRLEQFLAGDLPNLPLLGPKDSVAQLLESLTRALKNLIPLERQAFGLDRQEEEGKGSGEDDMSEDQVERIASRVVEQARNRPAADG